MKILVTGSKGQLGSDLMELFSASTGFQIQGLTRQEIDLRAYSGLRKSLSNYSFDCLINAAAYNHVDQAETNHDEVFDINAYAVGAMAEYCAQNQKKFFHISTDFVFDGVKNQPYLEGDAVHPINVYGASKAEGEKLALSRFPDCFILRVASLFGTSGTGGKGTNFVETMVKKIKAGQPLQVVGDITMSPTFTRDVVEALLQMLKQNSPPGIYHVVNSGAATWYEWAREIANAVAPMAHLKKVSRTEYPTVATRPPYTVLSNEKIASIVKMRHWKEALADYLQMKGHIP